jgi:hypothetical protein
MWEIRIEDLNFELEAVLIVRVIVSSVRIKSSKRTTSTQKRRNWGISTKFDRE